MKVCASQGWIYLCNFGFSKFLLGYYGYDTVNENMLSGSAEFCDTVSFFL